MEFIEISAVSIEKKSKLYLRDIDCIRFGVEMRFYNVNSSWLTYFT